MTAKYGPKNIFSLPIVILIAVAGLIFISTILILIHFIKKSKRKKRGYSFQLTDNSVEAYNLEEDVKPVASGNGSVVVVSDSYNLVDGWSFNKKGKKLPEEGKFLLSYGWNLELPTFSEIWK